MVVLNSLAIVAMMPAVMGEVPRTAGADTGRTSTDPAIRTDQRSVSVAQDATADSIHVTNVRFEAPPGTVSYPSVLLKFEVVNNGLEPLTDPLIRISVIEKVASEDVTLPRILVQPFLVTGTPLIAPGYSVDYQMLMQNLTVDCGCVARVTVIPRPRVSAITVTPIR